MRLTEVPRMPTLVTLDDQRATEPALVGAKAAVLARARVAGLPALPGFVLTTEWAADAAGRAEAKAAWRQLVADHSGARGAATAAGCPVVVRSSSTMEDGAESSMAGLFTSVLDVNDEADFDRAIDEVLASRT